MARAPWIPRIADPWQIQTAGGGFAGLVGVGRVVKLAGLLENKDHGYPAWESFVISRPAISFPYCRVNDALAGLHGVPPPQRESLRVAPAAWRTRTPFGVARAVGTEKEGCSERVIYRHHF